MKTARPILTGASSLAALLVLLVAVPLALSVTAGWPLPHSWPTLTQVRALLSTSGIPDVVLIDVLAMICWLAWLDLAVAMVVEIGATIRHRPAPRLGVLRPWQPLAARLITAIVITAGTIGSRAQPASPPHPTLAVALAARHPAGASRDLPARSPALVQREPQAASQPAADAYVVRGGDTLWDISGRRLGDPRQWPQIWHRNQGRREPGGRRFRDPNLIVPGWTLDLPGHTSAPTPSDSGPAAPEAKPSQAAEEAHGSLVIPPPVPTTTASVGTPARLTPSAPLFAPPSGEPRRDTGPGVNLPSGGFVGLAFAAGVVAGLAGARLHERWRRRVGSQQGTSVESLVGETVLRLRRALAIARRNAAPVHAAAGGAGAPDGQDTLPPVHALPGQISIGVTADGSQEAFVDAVALSGVAFVGPGAQSALRALIASALTVGLSEQAEIFVIDSAQHLLAGIEGIPGVDVVDDISAALSRIASECSRREQVLALQGAGDYRQLIASPDPLGLLLVVLCSQKVTPKGSAEAAALAERGRRLGVVIVADEPVDGLERLDVMEDGTVTQGPLTGDLARLFTLSVTETHELLRLLSAGRGGAVPTDEAASAANGDVSEHLADVDAHIDQADTVRPIESRVAVCVFGPPRVEVDGEEVTTGLREKARELLCLLAVRRTGLRLEEALVEMWPEDEEGYVGTFRVSVTATRRRLRELTGVRDGQFIVFAGDRYRLDTALVNADLWRFEHALDDAAHAADDTERLVALQRATSAVTGEPFAGAAYEWAEAARENLRRRAVDALGELAGLCARTNDDAGALNALERARTLDPYCEDLYRRLMRQLVDMGRDEAALRVYRELELRVAELGVEPEEETEALMVDIRSRHQNANGPRSYRQIFPKSDDRRDGDDDADEADVEATGFAARRTVIARNSTRPTTTSRPDGADEQDLPILDSDEMDIG